MADEPKIAGAVADPPSTAGGSDDGGTPEPPAPPSIEERLAWNVEEQGELPDDLPPITLDEIRADREAALTVERERAAQLQAERERQHGESQARLATDNDNITWLNGLRERLNSNDEAEKTAAWNERDANEERYTAASATQQRLGEEQQSANALRSLMAAGYREMVAAGYEDFMPDPSTPEFAVWARGPLAEFDGKGGFFAYGVAYGEARAQAKARDEGRDEGARDERIALGKDGAPAMSSGEGRKSPIADIDLSKPGAGRDLFRAGAAAGSRR